MLPTAHPSGIEDLPDIKEPPNARTFSVGLPPPQLIQDLYSQYEANVCLQPAESLDLDAVGLMDAAAKLFLSQEQVSKELISLAVPNLVDPAQELRPMHPEEIAVLFDRKLSKKEQLSAVARMRDLFFSGSMVMSDGRRDYVLIGLEKQAETDYSMPVRIFLENAIDYAWQVQCIAARNRGEDRELREKAREGNADEVDSTEKLPMTWKELLSGLRAGDRLKPVITIVVYWSTEPWTGPRHLQDLLDLPDELNEIADNNSIIVLEPASLTNEQISSCRTDFRLVLEFLRNGNDHERLKRILAADSGYEHMDPAAAQLIAALTGSKIQLSDADAKGGQTTMIPAIEQMIERERDNERERERDAANRDWARAMLREGIPIDTIARIAGTEPSTVKQWLAEPVHSVQASTTSN